jgi:hypothetical protein
LSLEGDQLTVNELTVAPVAESAPGVLGAEVSGVAAETVVPVVVELEPSVVEPGLGAGNLSPFAVAATTVAVGFEAAVEAPIRFDATTWYRRAVFRSAGCTV